MDVNFSSNPQVPVVSSFSLNIRNARFGARNLMMFISRKKAKVPGIRRKTYRIFRHLTGVRCVNCMLTSGGSPPTPWINDVSCLTAVSGVSGVFSVHYLDVSMNII